MRTTPYRFFQDQKVLKGGLHGDDAGKQYQHLVYLCTGLKGSNALAMFIGEARLRVEGDSAMPSGTI